MKIARRGLFGWLGGALASLPFLGSKPRAQPPALPAPAQGDDDPDNWSPAREAQELEADRRGLRRRGEGHSVIGFSPGVVAPGATVRAECQARIPFRAERLVLPSDVAGAFVIERVEAAGVVILDPGAGWTEGPITGRVFDEREIGVLRFECGWIPSHTPVHIVATNIADGPRYFRAALIGVGNYGDAS